MTATDWIRVPLGNVCKIQGGFAFKSEDYTSDPDDVPVIKIGDLQNGRVDITEKTSRVPFRFAGEQSLRKYLLRDHDVLIAMTGATTGKVGSYSAKQGQAFLNQRVGRFCPDRDRADNYFIQFVAQTSDFQLRIKESILVSAQGNISPQKLEAIEIPFPTLAEQRKIAGVLGLVQRAMEQQERLIALTTELKKSLLHQLFTQGLRGEPQKQTEIGPVPQSWEVVALGELVEEAPQVNMRTEAERNIQYIDVSSISREFLRIETTSSFVLKDAPGRARKKVKTGDVIFATVRPTLLRVARVAEDYDEQVCSTAFCVLRDKNRNTHGRYIYYLVQRERFIKQLAVIESGVSYPAVTDRQVKEQLVSVPDEGEQIEIARTLEACDAKISMHQRKHAALTALFRTLLHQLMTAQVRVHDLDLPELEIKQ